METSIKPQYLKGISWKGGRLEFVSSKGRADFSNMRKLDGIKYFAIENQFVKSINFSYYNLAESADKRLMLSEILDSTAGEHY